MAIQIQGSMGSIAEVDGTTYRALRITIRPTDYGLLGQYRISLQTGTIAAGFAAFGSFFYARWTATPQLAVIWGASLDGVVGGAVAFAAGRGYHGLQILRAWTVDGTGGTLVVLTGNSQKLRSTMSSSLMGTIRIATTVPLTLGTNVADAQGVGQLFYAIGTTASVTYWGQVPLYGSQTLEDGGNPAPIVLAQNEGIQISAAMPATGTWSAGVTMSWSEVNAY